LKTAVGPRHPSVAAALNLLADDYKAVPDHARAAAAYREAIAILVEADGAGHARVAEARGRLGMSLAALGDHKGAITELEAWLAGAEKLGADHADLVAPLAMLGGVLVDAGESARAIALLERALAMKTTHGKALASARFHLGRALWDREPTRAHTLVDAARAEFKSSPFGDDGVAEVDAWLRRPVTRDRERTR
jgi:tetratricopeptide (TPR) repeat protein